jgi:isoleucyl-tRNA synthetase
MKYAAIIEDQSKKLGQWMDWPNSYFTMSDENIESIWHFLKTCNEDGLLYNALVRPVRDFAFSARTDGLLPRNGP